MKKNEERTGTVVGIGMDGEGVIREEDGTVFVPYTFTGEKVRYKILKATSKCAYGKAIEILTPAEERVRPLCPVFGKCGGCQLQHIRYVNQLKIKEDKIATCFKKIAGLKVDVSATVKGSNEFRYRNKLQLPVGTINGETVIGFYAENSHRIIPINDCVINPEWTENIISAFKTYINETGICGYDEINGTGDLREITVKEVDGKYIVTAVILNKTLPYTDRLIEILKTELKGEFSLYLNINCKSTNYVYGDEFKLLYGAGEYTSEMLGVKYKIGVRSFMQVNPSVCCKLYSAVSSAVGKDSNLTVIDAYSGAGLMTAILAKKTKNAIGIEIVPEAVRLADEIAENNGLSDKMKNYCGDCAEILPKIIEEQKEKGNKTVLVLDPPRKGCDYKVIESVIKSDIDKIIYVSCKPSTLARDIGLITGGLTLENGEIKRVENPELRYEIEKIKPYDMFAQTKHVETLCVLIKK